MPRPRTAVAATTPLHPTATSTSIDPTSASAVAPPSSPALDAQFALWAIGHEAEQATPPWAATARAEEPRPAQSDFVAVSAKSTEALRADLARHSRARRALQWG